MSEPMDDMRPHRPVWTATRLLVALAALAAGCKDNDHTGICVGPGCETYDGAAGKNSLVSGDIGGAERRDGGASDGCELAFLTPDPGDAGASLLAPSDDVDGEVCGSSFSARVLLSSNASQVKLFVNDNPVGSVEVTGGIARFDAELGNRGQTGNTLRAEATMADGRHCSKSLGQSVFVGCTGPSCSISSPRANPAGFLNRSDDADDDSVGLQTDIVVTTEADHAGQTVTLAIDDAEGAVPAAMAQIEGSKARAAFPNVTLEEGVRRVRGECSDAENNRTRSPSIEWRVDISPCSLVVESVADGVDPITSANDVDGNAQNGVDVLVRGAIEGADCDSIQIGECGADLPEVSLRDQLAADGSFAVPIALPARMGSLELCARVEDSAGNVSQPDERVDLELRIDSPPIGVPQGVSFLSPANAAVFNMATGCDTPAVVTCSEDGAPIELFIDGLSQGSELCANHQATFSLTLPSKNDGAATLLEAVQTAQGVASDAASVSIQADCEAPVLAFAEPTCNAQLALEGDDVDRDTEGLQFDVNVVNGGVPDVILTVIAEDSTDVESSGDETSTEFPAVDLGGVGNVSLVACATDPQGNEGCAPSCVLAISAEPGIEITNPRPPAVFTIEDDCDPGALGLQIQVDGSSVATNGSPVEIAVGSGTASTTLLASGEFSACVQAPDGEDQTLLATVTDTLTGLSSSASIIVSINTSPPPAIEAPAFTVTGRREGTVNLTWESVLDASGDPLVAYHLRCSRTDITTEAIWDAATTFPVSVIPAATAGASQTEDVSNFRTGTERFCMVRGQDAYGQLSALTGTTPTVATISNPFLTLEYGSVTPTTLDGGRINVSALGDINGDDQADFAYGTQNLGVQIFFGGPGLDPTPDVSITLPSATQTTHEFGANVASLGDINGDELPDFAITARLLTQITPPLTAAGSVFVFFGRPATTPWPASLTVAANPGCGADICFHSSETLTTLGSAVASTNFDGNGTADLIIGSQNRTLGSTLRVGRAYVILGGPQLDVPSNTIFELPGPSLDGFTIDPTISTRNFGVSISPVGLGNDTLGDLVVGALGRSVEAVNGEAFYITGKAYPSGSSGLIAYTPVAPPFAVGTPNLFGIAAGAVGDVNADGFGDVWLSTNLDQDGVSPVFLGRSSGFSGVSLFGYTNDVVDNQWGFYVARGFHPELGRLGDLDNNGFDDLFVGSLFNTVNGPNGSSVPAPGTADLFYSDATTQNRLRSSADARFSSSGNGQMTPSFVGDISGDGFRDIAVLDSGPALPATRLTLFY
jgi:hypothetical protein